MGALGALKGAQGGLIGKITGAIPAAGGVLAQVGSITRAIQTTNLSNISSIGQTIAQITGNSSLFAINDRGAQIGVYSGILQEASSLGLRGTFGPLMAQVTDQHILSNVAQQSLPVLAANGDLQSLGDLTMQLGGQQAAMLYPELVQKVAQNYRIDRIDENSIQATDGAGHSYIYSHLEVDWTPVMGIMRSAQPDFGTYQRDEESDPIVSVAHVQDGSDDFQTMLRHNAIMADDMNTKLLVMGTVYPATTVDSELTYHFPETLTGPSYRQVTPVLDPVQAADEDVITAEQDARDQAAFDLKQQMQEAKAKERRADTFPDDGVIRRPNTAGLKVVTAVTSSRTDTTTGGGSTTTYEDGSVSRVDSVSQQQRVQSSRILETQLERSQRQADNGNLQTTDSAGRVRWTTDAAREQAEAEAKRGDNYTARRLSGEFDPPGLTSKSIDW